MAKILLTWELGSGLGHLVPLKQIALPLAAKGHQIFLAAADLTRVETVFKDTPVTLLQAPQYNNEHDKRVRQPEAFSHILCNKGYADLPVLKSLIAAWRSLFDLIEPDLAIFDHCPTAMAASLDTNVKRVLVGSGFVCPPITRPFGIFSPKYMPKEKQELLCTQDDMLRDNLNNVLDKYGVPPLNRLADIYQSDMTFLLTLPEFDHFGSREGLKYFGIMPELTDNRPEWPDKPGKKIFAYLKPFRKLPFLLQALSKSSLPVLVYSNNIPERIINQFTSDSISFVDSPVDLDYAASICDLAIVHANHSTSTQLFLQGVPAVMLPLHREQRLYAERAVKLGVGISASINSERNMVLAVNEMLENPAYKRKAMEFSAQYKGFDSQTRFSEMINAIHELAN